MRHVADLCAGLRDVAARCTNGAWRLAPERAPRTAARMAQEARAILERNKAILTTCAQELLKRETLGADDLSKLTVRLNRSDKETQQLRAAQ